MEAEFLTLMRAELDKAMAQLELRLVDRFASKSDMKGVNERLDDHAKVLGSLVAWRNRIIGAIAVVTFALGVVATASWHIWG